MIKTIIVSVITFVSLFASRVVFAISGVSNCEINGQQVDCAEVFNTLDKVGGSGIAMGFGILALFFLVMSIIGIVLFVFWVLMLIHALTKEIENKMIWVVVLIFTGFLGAIVYYFVVKREFDKKGGVAPVQVPPVVNQNPNPVQSNDTPQNPSI